MSVGVTTSLRKNDKETIPNMVKQYVSSAEQPASFYLERARETAKKADEAWNNRGGQEQMSVAIQMIDSGRKIRIGHPKNEETENYSREYDKQLRAVAFYRGAIQMSNWLFESYKDYQATLARDVLDGKVNRKNTYDALETFQIATEMRAFAYQKEKDLAEDKILSTKPDIEELIKSNWKTAKETLALKTGIAKTEDTELLLRAVSKILGAEITKPMLDNLAKKVEGQKPLAIST